LALCQRYYYRHTPGIIQAVFGLMYSASGTSFQAIIIPPVPMRVIPSAIEQTGTAGNYEVVDGVTVTTCSANPAHGASSTSCALVVNGTVASGLTAGRGGVFRSSVGSGTVAYLGWSAEL